MDAMAVADPLLELEVRQPTEALALAIGQRAPEHGEARDVEREELRGTPLPPSPERFWRDALGVLISGFAVPAPRRRPRTADRARR
jgi:hypothetical protein